MASLTAAVGGESSVVLTLSLERYKGARNINWWYKLSTESGWNQYSHTSVSRTFSGTKSMTITDLVPNSTYNFSASIYMSKGDTANFSKITEVFVNAKTAKAVGALTFPAISAKSITAQVSGLASVGYWRNIKYYIRKTGDSSWIYKATREIPPYTDPLAIDLSYTFTGLLPETLYDFAADLGVGLTSDDYYRTIQARAATGYEGISMPEIFDTDSIVLNGSRCHTITPPDELVTLTWWVPPANVVDDTIHQTAFKLYYQRDGEEAQVVGEWANLYEMPMSVYSAGAVTTNSRIWDQAGISAADWLGAKETIDVWVVAEHRGHKAESARVPISVTRYFYWDAEKATGDEFGITASEWNRLESYLEKAHELYPDYFDAHSASQVSGGDPVTALIANATGYRLHHERKVLLDSQMGTTQLLYAIYRNGYVHQAPDDVTEPISVTAEVTYGTHSISGIVEAELTTNPDGVKVVHVLPGQSIFESGLAPVYTTVKITVAYDVGEEIQTGEDVTAADANAFESYLHEKMYKATGH